MASKMTTATIAPGRTLVHTPIDPKDGKPAGAEKVYHPGESIELSVEDVARLREHGYLVDPSGNQSVDTAGPVVLSEPK